MVSDYYLEYWSLNPLHTWCMHWLCKSSEMKRYLAKLTIFSPLVAKKFQQSVAFNHYLVYWSLNTLHTGQCSFQEWLNFLATLAKFASSGGQRWPKLVVYDNWPVSWHFLAMSTVGLCWLSNLSNDTAIRSLDLLVCTKIQARIDGIGLSECSQCCILQLYGTFVR